MRAGDKHLLAHQAEVDRLDLFELPGDCPKCCPRCGGRQVRIVWNHRNTNSDFAYCSDCPERPSIGYIPKRFTGAPTKPKRRPDLRVSSDSIFERDAWRCQLCGASAQEGTKLEVAHILSREDGKKQGASDEEVDHPTNLFACCHDCNNERGGVSLPPLLILRLIRARLHRGRQ